MHLRDLEYFKYLAESLSFTKTAEHFFVSQPSISIALKRLEDEFQTKLIERERSAKNIRLTAPGKLLYRRTIEMLRLYGYTRHELTDSPVQPIQLGIIPLIANHYLPKLLATTNHYLYALDLIEEKTSDDIIQAIKDKKYSTAIAAHKEPTFKEETISSYLISQSPVHLWVSKSHPLATYKQVTVNDIIDEAFVCLCKGTLHEELFDQWANQHGISLFNVRYVNHPNLLAEDVESGNFVALLMDAISLNKKDLVSIPVKNAPICYISLITNNTMALSKTQKEFNQRLIDAI